MSYFYISIAVAEMNDRSSAPFVKNRIRPVVCEPLTWIHTSLAKHSRFVHKYCSISNESDDLMIYSAFVDSANYARRNYNHAPAIEII